MERHIELMERYIDTFIQPEFWKEFRILFKERLSKFLSHIENREFEKYCEEGVERNLMFNIITPALQLIIEKVNSSKEISLGLSLEISILIQDYIGIFLQKREVEITKESLDKKYNEMTSNEKWNYDCDEIKAFIRHEIPKLIDRFIEMLEYWKQSNTAVIAVTETPQIQNEFKIITPYKIKFLLMQEFGMFETEKYKSLNNIKRAKLLGFLFSVSPEMIRQDLSNVSMFKKERNNSGELAIILNDILTAKPSKKKKL